MQQTNRVWFMILIIAWSVSSISVIKAEKDSALALDSLVDSVIKRNPNLAATRHRIQEAQYVIPQAQSLDDPQFTFHTRNNSFGSGTTFMREKWYELSQKIPFPGKLRLRGEIAKEILVVRQNEEITTQRELIRQTKALYYRLYLNKVAQKINTNNKKIVERFTESASALYKTGIGKQSHILKAHVEHQMLSDELLMLQSEEDTLKAMINVLLDKPQQNPIDSPEPAFQPQIPLEYDSLEAIALRKRSELRGLKAMISEKNKAAKLAQREYFPDFTFGGMYQHSPVRNGNAWSARVGINIPIWIGQKQRKAYQEARSSAQARREDFIAFRSEIRGTIKELLSKINSAQERITLYENGLITKTIQTLSAAEAGYRTGKEDFLFLLDTRRQLQDFELRYEEARIERELLLNDLERAIGVPLKDIQLEMERTGHMPKYDKIRGPT